MKKLILLMTLITAAVSAQAGHFHRHGSWHGHRGTSVSFYYGASPYYYSPYYSSYSYAPPYRYDYSYARPNYAVGGTLLGALAGGIIGNSVHHQGWEGAGIGAAAGLVLGSVAEHNARARENAVYSAPVVYSQSSAIANSPTVNDAPTVPAAAQAPSAPVYQPVNSMSSANSLFGR
jgi:hypothetical protein